jgi:hypothetical protein
MTTSQGIWNIISAIIFGYFLVSCLIIFHNRIIKQRDDWQPIIIFSIGMFLMAIQVASEKMFGNITFSKFLFWYLLFAICTLFTLWDGINTRNKDLKLKNSINKIPKEIELQIGHFESEDDDNDELYAQ